MKAAPREEEPTRKCDLSRYAAGYRMRTLREDSAARDRAAFLGQAARERMVPILMRHGVRKAVLFGSVARGRCGMRADLDLAVEGIAPADFFGLYGELLMAGPVPVHLVDLSDCPPTLRACIDAEGEILYDRST